MDAAALRPCPMAAMMEAGPVTASPPAKIPLTDAASVSVFTATVPFLLSFRVAAGTCTSCPTARMTAEASWVYSLPLTATGRGLPLASGWPRAMRMHVARPFSMRTGAVRNSIVTPSSRASAISSAAAGISARVRRYRIVTSAPSLREARAASTAVLPPPTTRTFAPMRGVLPELTAFRKLSPSTTPGPSSPGMPILSPRQAPEATKTASKPFSCRASAESIFFFVRIFTPACSITLMSRSTTASGSR